MLPVIDNGIQNGTQYEIWLARDTGTRIAVLDTVASFSFTSVVNNVGAFALELPAGFDRTIIAKDDRVLFWRRPVGGVKKLAFVGLLRDVDTVGTVPVRTISGPDINDLLDTRIVAYAAGSAQAAPAAGAADTLITDIVTQNLGSTAGTDRRIDSYLSIALSPGAGPTVQKAFAYRNVLDVIREMCNAARIAGTPVYFGIVPTNEIGLEFCTRINEWGHDRTDLVFGPEFGNMESPHLKESARDERNFVYGLGQGTDARREIQTAEDTARSRASVFARREISINASSETTAAGVLDVARGKLLEGRDKLVFTAKLLSVPGSLYGVDWEIGDRVTVTYDKRQWTALVRAVTIDVDENGDETINATIETLTTETIVTAAGGEKV